MMGRPGTPAPPADAAAPALEHLPLWRIAVAVCVLGALLIPAAPRFFVYVDADILLSALVSLMRWTPYYWGQDRFGMLLPLLAVPVRDAVANLLFQMSLSTFAALFSVVLGARLIFGRREAIFAGLVALLALVLTLPPEVFFHFASLHPYGPSLALGFGGLLLLERPRAWSVLLGGVLILLAEWVNTAAALVLGPVACLRVVALVLGRVLRREPFPRWWRTAALLGPPLVVLGIRHPFVARPHVGRLAPAAWPEAWSTLGANGLAAVGGPWVGVVVASLVAGLVILAVGRFRTRPLAATALALGAVASALFAFAVTGMMEWVALNQFRFRYLVAPIALVHLAAVALPWLALGHRARQLRVAAPAVAAAILVAVVARYGVPSRRSVDTVLAPAVPYADALLAAGATHFAGSYWIVWPTVFELERRDTGHVVYPVAHRGEVFKERWENLPRDTARIARVQGDPDADWWLRQFGWEDARVTGRQGMLEVLVLPAR